MFIIQKYKNIPIYLYPAILSRNFKLIIIILIPGNQQQSINLKSDIK